MKIENRNMKYNRSKENKKHLVNRILGFIADYDVKTLDGWEHVDFSNQASLNKLKEGELESLYCDLNLIEDEFIATQEDSQSKTAITSARDIYIDSLEIVNRHKNGDLRVRKREDGMDSTIANAQWHPLLFEGIKKQIPTWKSDTIDSFYTKAKDVFLRNRKTDLMILLSQLSELIHERDQSLSGSQEDNFLDDTEERLVADLILFKVEVIVKPHIEVIEKNMQSGGKLVFADIWEQPFKETLKTKVRERDNHKCVICESEQQLHVHHKIPRKLGGVNHEDNLVTLCSSCHGVVEQADIQKAFVKCLSNYRKNKAISSINWDVPINKTQLKLQIEEKLDYLLSQLSKKNEELAKEVVEIMTRFEQLLHSEE